MGHINAAIQWLIQVFNDMWPLALATFCGAWLAFQHQRNDDKRREHRARRTAVRHVQLVVLNQQSRLKKLQANLGQKEEDRGKRRLLGTGLGDARLDISSLLAAFDNDLTLVEACGDAEHHFREVAELVDRRDRHVQQSERDNGDNAQALAARILAAELDSMIEEALERLAVVLEKIDEYLANECPTPNLSTVDHFAWGTLASAVAVSGVFFFSNWAVNGDALRIGLDIGLVSALVFAMSLYVSIGLCSVVTIMAVYSMFKRTRSFAVYFWAILVSVQPLLYLFWLDAR